MTSCLHSPGYRPAELGEYLRGRVMVARHVSCSEVAAATAAWIAAFSVSEILSLSASRDTRMLDMLMSAAPARGGPRRVGDAITTR